MRAESTGRFATHQVRAGQAARRPGQRTRSTGLDLVSGGAKVVGSAKRRRGGRALQHGSIVLRRHPRGGQEPGIEDLLGRPLDLDRLQDRLAEGLAAALGLELEITELPAAVTARARAGRLD